MKLQRAQIEYDGEIIECICEVSDPTSPQVIISFHRSWNNELIAEHIFDIITSNAFKQ